MFAAGILDKNAPHRLCCCPEEMRTPIPLLILIAGQAQPGFMNERGGLQRVAGTFVGHARAGKAAMPRYSELRLPDPGSLPRRGGEELLARRGVKRRRHGAPVEDRTRRFPPSGITRRRTACVRDPAGVEPGADRADHALDIDACVCEDQLRNP